MRVGRKTESREPRLSRRKVKQGNREHIVKGHATNRHGMPAARTKTQSARTSRFQVGTTPSSPRSLGQKQNKNKKTCKICTESKMHDEGRLSIAGLGTQELSMTLTNITHIYWGIYIANKQPQAGPRRCRRRYVPTARRDMRHGGALNQTKQKTCKIYTESSMPNDGRQPMAGLGME